MADLSKDMPRRKELIDYLADKFRDHERGHTTPEYAASMLIDDQHFSKLMAMAAVERLQVSGADLMELLGLANKNGQ